MRVMRKMLEGVDKDKDKEKEESEGKKEEMDKEHTTIPHLWQLEW